MKKKKEVKIEYIKNLLADCLKERKLKRLFYYDEPIKKKPKKI